ncbi:citrate/2-methylcitrate synthase [Nesterenkonia sp. PF2B19]|uniref:citrate/2-methylcitrate synthase n=1 Tax=Nesterenkonia sp. PF2B19 TaxID=1881858 RepID=UPI000873467D|nr:citrate/2-methylcitrate synthase [Nesterenkonia sp. PF2B19]OSM42748.1 citrate synthase/methylcitrate synthase [Nesterenkonia sp. PF2B19]
MSGDRMDETLIDVPRGLTNVAVTETRISRVRGHEGYYQYRDRSAIEMARTATFEEAWALLVCGTASEGATLRDVASRTQRQHRGLVDRVSRAVGSASAPRRLDVVSGLKAALPMVSQELEMRPLYDLDEAQRMEDVVVLVSLVPELLAAFHRLKDGRGEGREADGPAAAPGLVRRYLQQVTDVVPDPACERALSAYLVAAMEHGFNASTFTARVIASTGADVASCLAGALGSLTGPLHGGAPSRALDALDTADAAGGSSEQWLRGEVAAGRRIMGFGHPVYRTVDPRSQMLKQFVRDLGGSRVQAALDFEQAAERVLAELKPGRALHANLEFYASVLMERCGIPREMFTATFAVGRVVGWSAHILEQAQDSKIIRPSARFTGPEIA